MYSCEAIRSSSSKSTLFPTITIGILPTSRHTIGIQYSSIERRVSSRVRSWTNRTPWAPFMAVSWTPP